MNPDLVARDEQGKPYTVRYEAVNAMLLNEFLKEHRTVQKQEVTIQRVEIYRRSTREGIPVRHRATAKAIEALSTNLHKVSAQLETTRPAPESLRTISSTQRQICRMTALRFGMI